MSTFLEMATDALRSIKVVGAAVPITDENIATAIRSANLMMANEATRNRSFGYTTIAASSDRVTVPDWAEDWMTCMLAMRLAPYYGKEVSPELSLRYRDAYDAVLTMTVGVEGYGYFPSTMPAGAGSEGCGGFDIMTLGGSSGAFFGEQSSNDLTDGNGQVLHDSEGKILEETQ